MNLMKMTFVVLIFAASANLWAEESEDKATEAKAAPCETCRQNIPDGSIAERSPMETLATIESLLNEGGKKPGSGEGAGAHK